MNKLAKLFFLLALSLVLVACDDAEEFIDDLEGTPTPSSTASVSPTASPRPTGSATPRPTASATPNPGNSNPVASGPQNFIDGANGNLWKPVSENNGNVVVLFEPKWTRLFSEGCYLTLKNGSRERLFCGGVLDCFTNPNRMTLRSNVRCSEVSEVRVVCEEAKQTVTFTVPQSLRGQVCTRHD
jgi:hypothetical protein